MDTIEITVAEAPELVTIIVNEAVGIRGGTIKVTSADFTDETNYDREEIVGEDLGIFLNSINRYLEDDEWAATATGINILLPGFDSTENTYTLFIHILI